MLHSTLNRRKKRVINSAKCGWQNNNSTPVLDAKNSAHGCARTVPVGPIQYLLRSYSHYENKNEVSVMLNLKSHDGPIRSFKLHRNFMKFFSDFWLPEETKENNKRCVVPHCFKIAFHFTFLSFWWRLLYVYEIENCKHLDCNRTELKTKQVPVICPSTRTQA